MMTREALLNKLNGSGLAGHLDMVKKLLFMHAAKSLVKHTSEPEEASPQERDKFLLNSVGPAAAAAAVDHAIRQSRKRGLFKSVQFNGSYVNNMRLVCNEPMEAYSSYSNVLRQFLLPRYAYLDFDQVVDPRHQIDLECGYPKFITPIMYRYMYDRDDVARRVVDIYPDESWAADPEVYETDNEEEETEFEKAWKQLCEDHNVMQCLYRMDKLAGIGHYGALLLGIDDGADLEKPITEAELLAGVKRSAAKQQRNLLYLRPFDEYLSFVHMYETDVMSPRYGLPKFYNLVFLDMTIDAAGASIGTRLNRRVHWSRVVHVADNLQSSLVFGTPRMQPCFNRLLDLRKIKGGSSEMFWKGAFPGLSFEVDPSLAADEFDFDKEEFREELAKYSEGLQRYLRMVGVSVKSLAPQVADPERHVHVQMQAIAAHYGVPLRIFLGSEEGRLASSQDKLTWNTRLARRCRTYTEPSLIRNFVDRLIAIGVLPAPKSGKYFVDWGDLNVSTDEDKANLALKWTQALSQYVTSGIVHLIGPMDYMTQILGLRPRVALRIKKWYEENGGLEKLKKVDPSMQGNGTAENIAGKAKDAGKDSDKHTKRDSADKKSEGMSS